MNPTDMAEITFRRRSYFSSVLEDHELTSYLLELYQPKGTGGTLSEDALRFWKDLLTLFTRQLPKAIFTVHSLVEDQAFQNKLRSTWLPLVLDPLVREGVIEIRKCPEWHLNGSKVFANKNAFEEACRDVKIAIKAQLYVSTEVPYNYVWAACRKVCEGNEDLFRLVLDALPRVSATQDAIVFSSESELLAKGPIAEHGDTLRRLYKTMPKIEKVIKHFLSLEHSLKSEALEMKKQNRVSQHKEKLSRAEEIRGELGTLYEIRDMILRTERVLRKNMTLPEDLHVLLAQAVQQCTKDANMLLDITDKIDERAKFVHKNIGTNNVEGHQADVVDVGEWLKGRLQEYGDQTTSSA